MSTIPQLIIAEAQRQGVDPALALEVAQVESGMNQNAVSARGAIGVFQLMPDTAAGLGVDPNDLQQNIQGGVSYLRQLLAQFGDPAAALAAYNWGPGNVSNAIAQAGNFTITAAPSAASMPGWLALAPAETQNYVNKILNNVNTQYSVVAAAAAAGAGVSPGGSTSTLIIPSGLQAQPGPVPSGLVPGAPPPPPSGFSWGTAALVMGVILGIGLVLQEF
ncbi:MAG: lytic transglycosylase domain-containing protein [Acidobacteriia bacterium]|nr:lytic transglycosylase domain-containing protein [Terriglobia bacterium]